LWPGIVPSLAKSFSLKSVEFHIKAELDWNNAAIIVAGDGETDLSLFERATISFSPDTSPISVKSRADETISVERAGLLTPILERVFND
jgi:hydroxymethylpyrimidine pyrophosphatase-like HAD family hydrolase